MMQEGETFQDSRCPCGAGCGWRELGVKAALVAAVFLLLRWSGTYWVKLPLVVAVTFLASWAAYEVIRCRRWLRPALGLRPQERPPAAASAPT